MIQIVAFQDSRLICLWWLPTTFEIRKIEKLNQSLKKSCLLGTGIIPVVMTSE
jgi:hypothetical protein